MKQIILILALILFTNSYSQEYGTVWGKKDKAHYTYVSGAFDVNQAFHLKDNPRMEVQTWGFQWQVDAGVRVNHVAFYGFYGKFDNADYQVYGAGVDYYVNWFYENNIDLSVGIAYSVPSFRGDTGWNDEGNKAIRIQAQWFFIKDLAFGVRGVLQERADVTKGYVLEGQAYLEYKFNKLW